MLVFVCVSKARSTDNDGTGYSLWLVTERLMAAEEILRSTAEGFSAAQAASTTHRHGMKKKSRDATLDLVSYLAGKSEP